MLLQNLVQRLACGDVRLEADELLPGERFKLDGFLLGKRMLRVANQHQRVLAQRDDFELGVLGRIRDQPHVHDVAEHVLINLIGAAVFNMDVDRSDTTS